LLIVKGEIDEMDASQACDGSIHHLYGFPFWNRLQLMLH
jgi:hypothetical protein